MQLFRQLLHLFIGSFLPVRVFCGVLLGTGKGQQRRHALLCELPFFTTFFAVGKECLASAGLILQHFFDRSKAFFHLLLMRLGKLGQALLLSCVPLDMLVYQGAVGIRRKTEQFLPVSDPDGLTDRVLYTFFQPLIFFLGKEPPQCLLHNAEVCFIIDLIRVQTALVKNACRAVIHHGLGLEPRPFLILGGLASGQTGKLRIDGDGFSVGIQIEGGKLMVVGQQNRFRILLCLEDLQLLRHFVVGHVRKELRKKAHEILIQKRMEHAVLLA